MLKRSTRTLSNNTQLLVGFFGVFFLTCTIALALYNYGNGKQINKFQDAEQMLFNQTLVLVNEENLNATNAIATDTETTIFDIVNSITQVNATVQNTSNLLTIIELGYNVTSSTNSNFLTLAQSNVIMLNNTLNMLVTSVNILKSVVPVTQVALGNGMNGVGTAITSTGTIELSDMPLVSPGVSIDYATIEVDAQGRVETVSGGVSPLVSVAGGVGIVQTQTSQNVMMSLEDTPVTSGAYIYAQIEVDARGRITQAQSGPHYGPMLSMKTMDISAINNTLQDLNGILMGQNTFNNTLNQLTQDLETVSGSGMGTVLNLEAGTGIVGGPIMQIGTFELSDTAVDVSQGGMYSRATITVNAQGRIVQAMDTLLGVTQVTAGDGLSGGVITSAGTLSLPAVIPSLPLAAVGDAFNIPQVTVNATGVITALEAVPISIPAVYVFLNSPQITGNGVNLVRWDETIFTTDSSVIEQLFDSFHVKQHRKIVKISCRVVTTGPALNYRLKIGKPLGVNEFVNFGADDFGFSHVITWYLKTSPTPNDYLTISVEKAEFASATLSPDGTFLSIQVVGSY